jgi:hypothetical protein
MTGMKTGDSRINATVAMSKSIIRFMIRYMFGIQDSGYKIQDSGYKIQDSGSKIHDS